MLRKPVDELSLYSNRILTILEYQSSRVKKYTDFTLCKNFVSLPMILIS